MEEDLPSEFDVIVIGTGMVESIVAAAASRIGKTVLHLDSDDHYGGKWASFNFEGLQKLLEALKNDPNQKFLTNIVEQWIIGDNAVEEATEPVEKTDAASSENQTETKQLPKEVKKWSRKLLNEHYRKFNIDLTPKLLFARGPLVELLISSNIARYAEFRCVSRVMTWLDDKPVPVPCSRADVFSTSDVNIVEKRMLMKLLTSFINLNDDQLREELKDWKDKSFKEYLVSQKLTPQIIHYVLYAIAGGTDKTMCIDGILKCKQFLVSLGRYGNTPFLWPMYGSGELPQCFCRLCAVFGGVYCLNRSVDEIKENEKGEGKSKVSLKTNTKEISCEHLVVGVDKTPKQYLPSVFNINGISRAIFITNHSIQSSTKEQLTLLRFPPLDDHVNPVTVVEVGPSTGSCPKGLYVVHFVSKQDKTAKEDLESYAKRLFSFEAEVENVEGSNGDNVVKPNVFWSLYFNAQDTSSVSTESQSGNIYICPGPDAELDFDTAVTQAEEIFKRISPDSIFLPRAPDPEEIVFDDDTEHGPEFEKNDETESTEDEVKKEEKQSE